MTIPEIPDSKTRRRLFRRVNTPTLLQMEANECGAAALAIILSYYGKHIPLEVLRLDCGISRLGSNARNIIKAAKKYGLNAHGYRKQSESLIALPTPFIVFWNFNHFVVVEGIKAGKVFLNDPAYGPRTVTDSDFRRAFTGIVLTFEPGGDFKKGGIKNRPLISLLKRLGGSQAGLAWILLASVALAVLGLIIPGFLRVFVDDVLVHDLPILPPLLIVMTIVAGLMAGFTWLQQTFLLRLETKLSVSTSSTFLWHLLHLPIAFFEGRYAGDLGSRIEINNRVARSIAGELNTAFLSSVLVLFYIGLMLQYDALLTIAGVGFALLNILALRYFSRQRRDSNHRLLHETGKLVGTAMNGLQSIETLKVAGAEQDFFARVAGLHANMIDAQQELGVAAQIALVVPPLLTALNAAALLAVGSIRIMDGALSVGMLVALQWLMGSFLAPVNQLVRLGTKLQQLEGDLRRLDDVHHQPVASASSTAPVEQSIRALSGEIDLKDITFGYGTLEKPLFEKLNLQIEAGSFIGIVGASGSGKTTLAKLLVGLYPPWEGDILFDGKSRAAIPARVLHRGVAHVDQNGLLFEGSIRDNLTLWDSTIADDRLVKAAQDACIHDEILRRQDGYNYVAQEQGRNFSGGQRQQLDVARALATDPAVIILDEATSALDAVVERNLLSNLRQRHCTCILISHRLSAIRDCDEILVLDEGRFVERGTHAALLDAEGIYARLIRAETLTESPELPPVAPAPPKQHNPIQTQGDSFSADQEALSTIGKPLKVAFAQLRAVLSPQTLLLTPEFQRDRLLAVFQLLGRARHFTVKMPPETGNLNVGDNMADRAAAIAAASGVRTRTIRLQGQWWRQDNGALLAYMQQDNRPVALLPVSPRRYQLVDVVRGMMLPVTSEVAESLVPDAVMVYRSLPEGKLSLRAFLRFGLFDCRRDVLIMLGSGMAIGLLQLALPFLTAVLLDSVLPQGDRSALLQITTALMGSAMAAALFMLTQNTALLRIESRMESTMQSALWDRLLQLPVTFFRNYAAGDLGSRAVSLSAIREILSNAILNAIFSGVFSIFSVGLMFFYSAQLAWTAVFLALVTGLITVTISSVVLQIERQVGHIQGKLSGVLLQFLLGITRIRVAGAEEQVFGYWAERFSDQRRLLMQSRQAQARLTTFNSTYPVLALLCIFIVVAVAQSSHVLSLGGFLAFNTALALLLANIAQVSTAMVSVLQVIPLFERVRPILEARPEVDPGKAQPGRLSGEIKVSQVSFRYQANTPLVLHDLSLTLRPEEFVALVGPSGCGKSTLLRLLIGFEQPTSGSIHYDERDLAGLDVRALRGQLGVVLQSQGLVAAGRDIFYNIVGTLGLTLDDAWEAARLAGLTETIRAMPMGMHTILMGSGTPLSAGQQQQLMIARAIATKPQILLFDEATGSLDNHHQALVSQNLAALRMTRLVIAHRLSTVIHADRILVMDKGHIVQVGTYPELIHQSGLFADLVRDQILQ